MAARAPDVQCIWKHGIIAMCYGLIR